MMLKLNIKTQPTLVEEFKKNLGVTDPVTGDHYSNDFIDSVLDKSWFKKNDRDRLAKEYEKWLNS